MAVRECANRESVKSGNIQKGNPVPSLCREAKEGQEIRAYRLRIGADEARTA